MNIKHIIYLGLIVFIFSNCKNDLIKDEMILSDIFHQLVDSLHLTRTNIFPPPPPPIYDNDSNFIGIDTIVSKQIIIQNERILKEIDDFDSRIILGIIDTRTLINLAELEERYFEETDLIKNIRLANIDTTTIELNISIINPGDGYELIEKSELELIYKDLWRINDRKFGGLISVSKIYLNESCNLGLFQVETYPFKLEVAGCFIIIERIKGKWRIKKIL